MLTIGRRGGLTVIWKHPIHLSRGPSAGVAPLRAGLGATSQAPKISHTLLKSLEVGLDHIGVPPHEALSNLHLRMCGAMR